MNKEFQRQLKEIALPVTVQSLMQSSLSLIDQIMIGSLGSDCIAGVGLAGKFTSLYSVTLTAIVSVAGILIAQYRGAKDERGVSDSFFLPFYFAMLLTAFFSVVCLTAPKAIMALYSDDADTVAKAAVYLKWRTLEFLPSALTLFFSTMLRNMNKAKLPAIAGIVSIFSNTLFNWLLIFGIGIFPRMEEAGAAMATSIARFIDVTCKKF